MSGMVVCVDGGLTEPDASAEYFAQQMRRAAFNCRISGANVIRVDLAITPAVAAALAEALERDKPVAKQDVPAVSGLTAVPRFLRKWWLS